MYLIDLEGNEFMLETTTKKTLSLSGDRSLSFVVQPTKTNKAFIQDIGELWQLVEEDETEWTIIYVKSFGKGNSLSVEVKAVPRIFDYMNTNRLYEERDEHMTAFQCFEYIFEDTPYNFQLMDSFLAVQWQGFGGGKTLLEQFKDALNRYDAEFTIVGNEVRLYHQIGRDTEFMYHYKLNASNISKEADAEELWTYAKGFGDYESDEEPKLTREYRSPLADIVGVRHAPPFRDGRVKNIETMDRSLKELVDSSLKVSVTATLHDLREQGYPLAQPEPGDRVFLIDDRIDLKEEMRVVDLEETRNQKGELLNVVITLGSEGLGKRRQADIKHALAEITEVVQGRRQLPITALDNSVREATRKLLNADTEITFTEDNGLLMVSEDDPNKMVIANSEGIGVSTDGGASFVNAITGDGVNTDLLTAGSIDAQRVRITAGGENVLWVDGETGEVRMNVSSMSINFEPVATKKDLEEIETTPGDSAVSAVLTKENHIIPVNPNNNSEDYTGAESQISVLQGDTDVTEDWDITIIPDENISGENQEPVVGETKFKVTSMTGDTGSVWFEARKGDSLLRREFRLTKVADGRDGGRGVSVTDTKIMFYSSASPTELSDGRWESTSPDWQNGRFIWTKTVTSYSDGSETETDPVNITGSSGSSGRSVVNLQEQYYLSTSKEGPVGGSWSNSVPHWEYGYYIWTRIKITYSTPPETDYTEPVIDSSWEAIENIEIGVRNYVYNSAEPLIIEANGSENQVAYKWDVDEYVLGKDVTVSFGFQSTVPGGTIRLQFENGEPSDIGSDTFEVTDEVRRVSSRMHFSGENINRLGVRMDGVNGTITIAKPQIQIGNKATDWVEAQEDVDKRITEKADQESVDNISTQLSEFESIAASKEELGEIIVAMNEYRSQLENNETTLTEASRNISNLMGRVAALDVHMGEYAAQMTFLDTYIRKGEEGILIGSSSGNTAIRISDQRIDFLDGSDTPVAFITNQVMQINRGVFLQSATIGEHNMETITDGHTILQYIG